MAKRNLPPDELEITHVKGSGPGGQNRNKRMSGVRVVHTPTGISVLSTERRSQNQNLQAGIERLGEKVAKHFHRPKKRKPTRSTKGAKERRLHSKRVDGARKASRRKPGGNDF